MSNPSILSSLVGRQIGWLRVNSPVVNLNRGYECAAWWQEETSALGIFPLILREDPYSKGKFYATATLPAKVTDCNFASLWCGNPIGKYDKSSDLGRDASISFRVNLPELVNTTGGHYPDKLPQVEYTVIWQYVPAILAQWQASAKYWLETAYSVLSGTFGGEKDTNSFGYYAQFAAEYALQGEAIKRNLGYMTEASDSWRNLAAKNFAWIPAAE